MKMKCPRPTLTSLTFILSLIASAVPGFAQTNGSGTALSFDGVNDHVRVPSAVWFNGNFTVEGWVYVRSYNDWSRLIDFGNGVYQQNVYLTLTEGGTGHPKMGIFDAADAPGVGSTQQLPLNQWSHLAATFNAGTGSIYINGNLVGSGPIPVTPPNVTRTNNYIGRSNWGSDPYANAIFDEVRIWNVARTQPQIAATMRHSLPRSDTSLVGYWKFNDGSGDSAADFTSSGRNGTLMGGVTWTNSTAPIVTRFGTAVSFNGGQSVDVPHQTALNAYPLTVSAWFKTTQAGLAPLVNKYVSSSYNGWQMFLQDGRLTGWFIRNGPNSIFMEASAGTPAANDGQWHHAAFTVDASGGRLYQDGVLVTTLPWSGIAGPVTTGQLLSFGHYPGDSLFVGQLDEVSIWNTALPAESIRLYATEGLVGTETNLLAYYRLDEGAGTTTVDGSGNGNNGTLQGGATWVASLQAPNFFLQTLAATAVTRSNAVLHGTVSTKGLVTAAWFQYGATTNYGSVTAPTNFTDGSFAQQNVAFVLGNLSPGSTYHYRLVASNSIGTSLGENMSFRTLGGVFAVTNLSDGGSGSLRELIATAGDDIVINIATNGTITLINGELRITNSVTISGPGATNLAISGNHASRVFNIATTNANVTISGITIRDGFGSFNGGGVLNAGNLTLSSCVVSSNRAANGGSAELGPGSGGPGGTAGIFNSGNLVLTACTLSDNIGGNGGNGGDAWFAVFSGAAAGNGGGGGAAALYNSGTAKLINCTLSRNTGGNGGAGGAGLPGIFNPGAPGVAGSGAMGSDGFLVLIACTVAGNVSGTGADSPGRSGIFNASDAERLTVRSCIVAQNPPSGADGDLRGLFTSAGHNLIGVANGYNGFTNGVNGDRVGSSGAPLDPGLTPFDNYGGPTQTRQLLPGSPALDTGDDALLNAPDQLSSDQRGLSRKVGPHVDIGAVESEIVWPPPSAITLQVTPNQDPIFGLWMASLRGTVNPGGAQTATWFQFGQTIAYGGTAPAGTLAVLNTNNTLVSATISNLVESRTYHYRVVASNSLGIFYGADRTFSTTPIQPTAGDLNGDGIVDQSELNIVRSNYFLTSPWLQMTNTAGLGGTNVTFALSGAVDRAFTVEYSIDLTTWQPLGPATPRYEFTDTNAPAQPQRHYRLRWP